MHAWQGVAEPPEEVWSSRSSADCWWAACGCIFSLQPDGVQRGLVGDIIKRFEQRGYTLKGLKLMNVERALAEKHYADLSSKPFFAGLVDYICSGPVVAMVRGGGVVWGQDAERQQRAGAVWRVCDGCGGCTHSDGGGHGICRKHTRS